MSARRASQRVRSTLARSAALSAVPHACRHHVWEIMPRKPDLSTGASTKLCIKMEEAGTYAPEQGHTAREIFGVTGVNHHEIHRMRIFYGRNAAYGCFLETCTTQPLDAFCSAEAAESLAASRAWRATMRLMSSTKAAWAIFVRLSNRLLRVSGLVVIWWSISGTEPLRQ
jgi:hypothetical protein